MKDVYERVAELTQHYSTEGQKNNATMEDAMLIATMQVIATTEQVRDLLVEIRDALRARTDDGK